MSRADENYIPVTVGTNPLMIKDVELRKAFMEGAAVFAAGYYTQKKIYSKWLRHTLQQFHISATARTVL